MFTVAKCGPQAKRQGRPIVGTSFVVCCRATATHGRGRTMDVLVGLSNVLPFARNVEAPCIFSAAVYSVLLIWSESVR